MFETNAALTQYDDPTPGGRSTMSDARKQAKQTYAPGAAMNDTESPDPNRPGDRQDTPSEGFEEEVGDFRRHKLVHRLTRGDSYCCCCS
jgi:hypothetical protein